METKEMGRVTAEAEVVNLKDAWNAESGLLPVEKVRRITIPDALIDTGAMGLSLPTRLIRELGLTRQSEHYVMTSAGRHQAALYNAVRLTIQGRSCTVDVLEVPDDCPALIGQIPLEILDFVVDPKAQQVIGNPAHGGEYIIEMY